MKLDEKAWQAAKKVFWEPRKNISFFWSHKNFENSLEKAIQAYVENDNKKILELCRKIIKHDWVGNCQECAVGSSPEWKELKEIITTEEIAA